MKNNLLAVTLLFSTIASFSQTAVNFTVDDCNSTSMDLFTQLDAGKVVVMTWVMPCGACISVASNVNTVVAGYVSSNPGNVLYYLVDDYANTTCSTLDSWANTNSISADAVFSNSKVKMSDYGSTGMQKTVVLGGIYHKVYYNVVGSINSASMQTAINSALAETGISERNNNNNIELNIFPNPAINNARVVYKLNNSTYVNIDVFNIIGEKVKTVNTGKLAAGDQETQVNFETSESGVYFIRLNTGEGSGTSKFSVIH